MINISYFPRKFAIDVHRKALIELWNFQKEMNWMTLNSKLFWQRSYRLAYLTSNEKPDKREEKKERKKNEIQQIRKQIKEKSKYDRNGGIDAAGQVQLRDRVCGCTAASGGKKKRSYTQQKASAHPASFRSHAESSAAAAVPAVTVATRREVDQHRSNTPATFRMQHSSYSPIVFNSI